MDGAGPIRTYIGIVWKLALFIGVLIGASYAGNWVTGQLTPHLTPSTEPTLHRLIMTAITVYVLLMMLPFVPGVEIGLAMMVMFGPEIVPLVYGGTVLALVLAFLLGRLVPQQAMIETLETFHLRRAGGLLRNIEALSPDERVEYLFRNASTRIVPFLLRHRFLAVMVALNLPGNALIGGGGGICLMAGFSRLFVFPQFLVAVAVAVAPVPLLVFVTGTL